MLKHTLFLALAAVSAPAQDRPYQATGIKICEVDSGSAIIWTRLTRNAQQAGPARPLPIVLYKHPKSGELMPQPGESKPDWEPVVRFPGDATVDTIRSAAPGTGGEVRVLYRLAGARDWIETSWQGVDEKRDYTSHIPLRNLRPAAAYEIRVESRKSAGAPPGQAIDGRFRTAPRRDADARVLFTVITGQSYEDQDVPGGGFKIYREMLKLDPSFFVHTGDILYYDKLAKSLPLARWHWAAIYGLRTNVDFHRQVASYFIKDDHDTLMDDCWPTMRTRFMGEFTFAQGQAVFLEQVGMGPRTYRNLRWGRDLEIWLPEGRDFRSPNNTPDGPEKSIWGKEQKQWFMKTVQASDATFRLLISPTPLVGPDRANKHDNHSNKDFQHEGNELRTFLAAQKNMYVICGDRHWQYVSIDPKTRLREYSTGPASNQHAGGWPKNDKRPEHVYLNVTGGFLAGVVERENGRPVLFMRHHGVDGALLHEERLPAK